MISAYSRMGSMLFWGAQGGQRAPCIMQEYGLKNSEVYSRCQRLFMFFCSGSFSFLLQPHLRKSFNTHVEFNGVRFGDAQGSGGRTDTKCFSI